MSNVPNNPDYILSIHNMAPNILDYAHFIYNMTPSTFNFFSIIHNIYVLYKKGVLIERQEFFVMFLSLLIQINISSKKKLNPVQCFN
jgi:hypothetical protein